jgi:hypothetical protein
MRLCAVVLAGLCMTAWGCCSTQVDQTYTTREVGSVTGWSLWRFRYDGAKSKIRLTLQNEAHPSSAVIDFTKASHPPEEVVLGIRVGPGAVEYECVHVFGSATIAHGGEFKFYPIGSCNSMETHEVGALSTDDVPLLTLDVRSNGEDGETVKVPVTIRLEN